jgi:hypothetical protein
VPHNAAIGKLLHKLQEAIEVQADLVHIPIRIPVQKVVFGLTRTCTVEPPGVEGVLLLLQLHVNSSSLETNHDFMALPNSRPTFVDTQKIQLAIAIKVGGTSELLRGVPLK